MLGMKLNVPDFVYSKEKIIISAAGPLASFVMGIIFFFAKRLFKINSPIYTFFTLTNFAIGFINLLPVFPLDGARILKALLTMKCGIINSCKKTVKISDIVCSFIGICVFTMSIYKIFNPALMGIFGFLLMSKEKQRNVGICEKSIVLSGKIHSKNKIKYIACDADSELLCLAGYISCDYELIVATFIGEKFFGDLNSNDIIKGIKKYGALCTAEKYIKKQNAQNLP